MFHSAVMGAGSGVTAIFAFHVGRFYAWLDCRTLVYDKLRSRPRTRRHDDSLSSASARARWPLSLRAAAAHAGAGQREARAETRHIPIMVIINTDTLDFAPTGLAGVMSKRVTAEELVAAVENCLRERR